MSRTVYTSVRVPADIADRLASDARSLEAQAERGTRRLPDRGQTGKVACPLWHAIEVLLDDVEAHRARARAQRSGRPTRTQTAGGVYAPASREGER